MLSVTRILDRLGYEEKDERFVKNFIKEQEMNFRFVKRIVWTRLNPAEVKSFSVTQKGDKLLRIQRLEKVINQRAKLFYIQVRSDGFDVIMK